MSEGPDATPEVSPPPAYVWCPYCSSPLTGSAAGEPGVLACPRCGGRSEWEAARTASAAWVAAQEAMRQRDIAEAQYRQAYADYQRAVARAIGREESDQPPQLGPPAPEATAGVPGAAVPVAAAPRPAFGVAAMLQTIGALLLVAALVTASAVLWGRMQPWQQLSLLWAMVIVVGVVAGLLSSRLHVIPRVLAALTVAAGFVVAVAAAQLSGALDGRWYPPLVCGICAVVLLGAGRLSALRLWAVAGAALLPITAALTAAWAVSSVLPAASAEGLTEIRPTATAVSLVLAGAAALLALVASGERRPSPRRVLDLLGGRAAVGWLALLSLLAAAGAALLVILASLPLLLEGGVGERVWVSAALAGVGCAMAVVGRCARWPALTVAAGVPLAGAIAAWVAGPPAMQPLVAIGQSVVATMVVGFLMWLQWRRWPRTHVRWLLGLWAAALVALVLIVQVLTGAIATAEPFDLGDQTGVQQAAIFDSYAPLTAIVTGALVGALLWLRGSVLRWRPGPTADPAVTSSASSAPRPRWLSWSSIAILAGTWLGIVVQAARAGVAPDAAPEALCLGFAALALGNLRYVGPRVSSLVTAVIVAAAILPSAVIWVSAPLDPDAWGGTPWWRPLIVIAGVAALFALAARAKGTYTVPVTFVAALAVGHVWVWASLREAPPVEVFTLPLAAATAAVLITALHPRGPLLRPVAQPPHWYSMLWLGLPLVIALVPSALGAEADGTGAPRFWVLVLLCVAGVIVGARAEVAGLLVPTALALVIAVVPVIVAYVAAISTWIPLTIGGLLLIVVGIRFEQARFQSRKFAHWVGELR